MIISKKLLSAVMCYKDKDKFYLVKSGIKNPQNGNTFIFIVKKIKEVDENNILVKMKDICSTKFDFRYYGKLFFFHNSKKIRTFKELMKYGRKCNEHKKQSLFYIGKI